jgi:hypothetical protein
MLDVLAEGLGLGEGILAEELVRGVGDLAEELVRGVGDLAEGLVREVVSCWSRGSSKPSSISGSPNDGVDAPDVGRPRSGVVRVGASSSSDDGTSLG